MKDFDEQDDLWQLLGKAKKNAVSPLFSRNVLREIRSSGQEQAGVFSWLRLRWRVVSLGGIAAILLALNFTLFKAVSPSANNSPQIAKTVPIVPNIPQVAANAPKVEDTEVINHLDELLAYEKNTIWLEDSGR